MGGGVIVEIEALCVYADSDSEHAGLRVDRRSGRGAAESEEPTCCEDRPDALDGSADAHVGGLLYRF
jgi:hypothetical protein